MNAAKRPSRPRANISSNPSAKHRSQPGPRPGPAGAADRTGSTAKRPGPPKPSGQSEQSPSRKGATGTRPLKPAPAKSQTDQGEPARIQKVLADAGLGSRREIEAWIAAGRISVNGQVAKLGDRLAPGDGVLLDGKPLALAPSPAAAPIRVIAYHKPEGEIVTRQDPEGRPTVFDHLPPLQQGRWISIGRLDINTSGLLLLTNNGELGNRLMHPSQEIEREYAVRILGEAPRELLQRLVQGVELDDGPARFEEIVESDTQSRGANRWYHVLLREGRKREVRRLWEAVGLKVSRLMRVRFGNVILEPHLFTHQWRDLSPEELHGLLELAGMTPPSKPRPPPRHPSPWPKGRPQKVKGSLRSPPSPRPSPARGEEKG